MKKQVFAPLAAILISTTMVLVTFFVFARSKSGVASAAQADPMQISPIVALVDPATASNDLDTPISITGDNFVATPTVYLGDMPLSAVTWVSATLLDATVPWGMTPGVYTLTVSNPGGETGSLTNAITITEGIGVWNATTLYGGSVQQIVLHPQTPETVYAVSSDVGMFRSEDGAETWTLKVMAGGEYSVHNLAINPVSPNVLYMYMPYDLHRSDDGGDTWTPLNAPGDNPFPHPTESGTLFVSNGGGGEGESGLWKSTNYGQTWETASTGLTDTLVTNLVFDPTDPMTIYVGTDLGNLFVSSNGGASWTWVARPTDLIGSLAINPRGDHEMWVSNACFSSPRETLKSTNAGYTEWTPVADPVGSTSITTFAFPPAAWGGEVYSSTLFVNACFGEAYLTSDSGVSWSQFGPQTISWSLVLHPTDPNIMYRSSSWEAVIKTTDGGATWNIANEGLTAVVPRQLVTVPGQPETLYAITERPDGIYKGTRGGEAWQFLTTPDGDWGINSVLVDPVTPARVYAGAGDPQDRVLIYISEDGGETWPITSIINVTGYPDCNNWPNVIAAHPSQPGVLLLGVEHFCMGVPGIHEGDIYYSTDSGLNWTEATISGMEAISPVVAIAYDALIPTTVYAATSIWDMGTGILRSTDGGLNWERVGSSVADLDRPISIAVEPRPPYRVFVLTSGLTNMWVYVSADQGLTWSQTSIVHGSSLSLLSSHNQPDSILYLVTGIGLLQSTDGGSSWGRAAGVLGQVPVYSLAEAVTDDRTVLYAGTTGGYLESTAAQGLNQAINNEILVNAGVYRFTTKVTWQIYLPLVKRVHTIALP